MVLRETLLIPNIQIFDFYDQKLWLELFIYGARPLPITKRMLDNTGAFNYQLVRLGIPPKALKRRTAS